MWTLVGGGGAGDGPSCDDARYAVGTAMRSLFAERRATFFSYSALNRSSSLDESSTRARYRSSSLAGGGIDVSVVGCRVVMVGRSFAGDTMRWKQTALDS